MHGQKAYLCPIRYVICTMNMIGLRMKRFLYSVIAVMVASSVSASRVETCSVDSRLLGTAVWYNVYLPDGYDGSVCYPVAYLLHGLTDTYTAWVERGDMQRIADEAISSGRARPMVIVMPNAGGPVVSETWNGYFNMPGWPYHDFFFQELLPEVEKRFNCGGAKERRAIMGLSMGGGGSVVYAQRHTDMFCACYAMSAWLTDDDNAVRQGKNPDKVTLLKAAVTENSALRFVETADETRRDSLRRVRWFVDCGDDDFLFDQSVRLHQLMRVRRIPGELRIRNGGHTWTYWQEALRMALPFAFPG